MSLRRRELAAAASELDAAIDWYAAIRAALAVEFLNAVDAAIAHIMTWPDSARPYPGREGLHPVLRTTRVTGFPYNVIYLVDGEVLVIVADAHEKRRPGYWQQRLTTGEPSDQEAASDSPDN